MRRVRISAAAASVALALAIAPLTAGAAAATGAGSTGHTKVVGNCKQAQYKPRVIILTCGDANAYINHITWSSWTHDRASGSATLNVNACKPNCAAGKFLHKPVTIVLKNVKTQHKQAVFTTLVTIKRNGHATTWQPGI